MLYRINENTRRSVLSGNTGIKALQKDGWGLIPSEIVEKSFKLKRHGTYSGMFQYELSNVECERIGLKVCSDSSKSWKLKEEWIIKDISYKLDLI